MRYPPGHAASTRDRIVRRSATLFRRDGIAATGVDAAMKAAGLTPGGFYAHFRGKHDLVARAVSEGLEENVRRLGAAARKHGLVKSYLSEKHRDDIENGCTVAALAAEVARSPRPVKVAFGRAFEGWLKSFGREHNLKRTDLLALMSTMLGALLLARAVPDPATSRAALAAGRRGARRILGARP